MGHDAPLRHPYDGFLPTGFGARGSPDPREGKAINRTDSNAAPNAHSSEASITSGRNSPDLKVALRSGYRSPRRRGSYVRATSACKTGRNMPFSVNDTECLDLATPEVPSAQRNVKGFCPATDVPPATDEPVRDGSPPQGATAATPSARSEPRGVELADPVATNWHCSWY